jgi:hypothetical protein
MTIDLRSHPRRPRSSAAASISFLAAVCLAALPAGCGLDEDALVGSARRAITSNGDGTYNDQSATGNRTGTASNNTGTRADNGNTMQTDSANTQIQETDGQGTTIIWNFGALDGCGYSGPLKKNDSTGKMEGDPAYDYICYQYTFWTRYANGQYNRHDVFKHFKGGGKEHCLFHIHTIVGSLPPTAGVLAMCGGSGPLLVVVLDDEDDDCVPADPIGDELPAEPPAEELPAEEPPPPCESPETCG